MINGTETIVVTPLASNVLFWMAVFRYYHNVSVELSQYAQGPIRSPLARATIVSLSGFTLAMIFLFSCILQNTTIFGFVTENGFTILSLFVILLSTSSPIFNYISICIITIPQNSNLSMLIFASIIISGALVFFAPLGYILCETRREIELRFQAAVSLPPKRLSSSFKLHGSAHGNPVVVGVLSVVRGLVLFPTYLYSDLLRARQGSIVYQRVSRDEHVTRVQKVEFDVGRKVAAVDEALIDASEMKLCPRCKKPLIFLEDQQKWWCKRCRRASYVND
jgi:ribosomal protein S27AE